MNGFSDADKLLDQWPLADSMDYIESIQLDSGLIPWYNDGPADPWDHVESAMAMSLSGCRKSAREAFSWMANNQLPDGSWWAVYESNSKPGRSRRETHRVAYVSAGVWHHYLVYQNEQFLRDMWPTVRKAIEFTLQFQTEHGDVEWALMKDGTVDHDSLLTGCSSIYLSLDAAIKIAGELNESNRRWIGAKKRLGQAIRNRPDRFDRHWESKERYAMDWFYPILSGAMVGQRARSRIHKKWNQFVENGLGCRCVMDEPWVTVAETCELVIALKAIGEADRAGRLFSWIHQWLDDDGGYWTGYQFDEDLIWPAEKPTWTAGAVLLATDALFGISDASEFFTDHSRSYGDEVLAGSG